MKEKKNEGKWKPNENIYLFLSEFNPIRNSDFNGTCFAATQCRIFNVGESWELTPFCGISKCVSKYHMFGYAFQQDLQVCQ